MTKKSVLTVDALTKPKTREVEVDGGIVIIRQMSAGYAMALRNKGEDADTTFQLISDLMVEPKLTVEQVKEMSTVQLKAISAAIAEFSGLNDDAEANLKNDQTEGSTIN